MQTSILPNVNQLRTSTASKAVEPNPPEHIPTAESQLGPRNTPEHSPSCRVEPQRAFANLDVLAAAVFEVLVVRAARVRTGGPRARAAVGRLRRPVHRAAHQVAALGALRGAPNPKNPKSLKPSSLLLVAMDGAYCRGASSAAHPCGPTLTWGERLRDVASRVRNHSRQLRTSACFSQTWHRSHQTADGVSRGDVVANSLG